MATKIKDQILDILGECRVDGNIIFLPDRQLDRSTYQAVNKVLENIGGKWNRKVKGHVFDVEDPAELLDGVILTGEITDMKKQFQFFPTPRTIGNQMCDLAELDDQSVVLEPSCGKGDLADAVYDCGVQEVYGIELNTDMERFLKDKPYPFTVGVDFLTFASETQRRWPRIVMNPPFSKQQDIDHIMAAYNLLLPGGILVTVCSESPFFRSNQKSVMFQNFLAELNAEIISLDSGAFKESDTMVRTRLIKIEKPIGATQ